MNENRVLRGLWRYADKNGLDIDYYPGCSEPGYEDKPVIAADWNGPGRYEEDRLREARARGEAVIYWENKYREKNTMSKLGKMIESMESVSLEWSDEWMGCCDCGKAIRQSPNGYDWVFSGLWASDCDVVCLECYGNNVSDIINMYQSDYHHGFTNKAVNSDFVPCLESEGFVCWQEDPDSCAHYETGWRPGQDDDPHKVFDKIMADSQEWEIVFVVTGCGQFDVDWTAYVRKANNDD